jgi:hypothetical protein
MHYSVSTYNDAITFADYVERNKNYTAEEKIDILLEIRNTIPEGFMGQQWKLTSEIIRADLQRRADALAAPRKDKEGHPKGSQAAA